MITTPSIPTVDTTELSITSDNGDCVPIEPHSLARPINAILSPVTFIASAATPTHAQGGQHPQGQSGICSENLVPGLILRHRQPIHVCGSRELDDHGVHEHRLGQATVDDHLYLLERDSAAVSGIVEGCDDLALELLRAHQFVGEDVCLDALVDGHVVCTAASVRPVDEALERLGFVVGERDSARASFDELACEAAAEVL